MSYLESDFISRSEYDAAENQRIQGDALRARQIYVAMFALLPNQYGREAAALPVKIEEMGRDREDVTIYSGSIALLDIKLREVCVESAKIMDGYWKDVDRKGLSVSGLRVSTCYLLVRGDPSDGETQTMSTAIAVPKRQRQLAGVL